MLTRTSIKIINALIDYQMNNTRMPNFGYLCDRLKPLPPAQIKDCLNAGIKSKRGKVMFYEEDDKIIFVPTKKTHDPAVTQFLRNMSQKRVLNDGSSQELAIRDKIYGGSNVGSSRGYIFMSLPRDSIPDTLILDSSTDIYPQS